MKIYVLQEWIGDNFDGYWSSVSYTFDVGIADAWNFGNPDHSYEILKEYVHPDV